MDFLIVADVFSKYFLVRKLANSTSAAVCAEIATIVTELGLSHIIRSDNGPCYNSKEFQQLLQRYNITHHTSSPHHPRSNGFVERMVEVAWEPATVISQCTTNSYWIMQENGTEQPKVYRRTRTMLKIRCTPTEVEQTGYRNSQSTESEKAEFHTPAIANMTRNCVEHNPAENISQDLVQPTTLDTQASVSFDF